MEKQTNAARPRIFALIFFFVLSYMLSWSYMIPGALYSHGMILAPPPGFLSYIAAYGPAISAVIATLIFFRGQLRILLKRIVIWRVNIRWYIIALFLQPVLLFSGLAVSALLGSSVDFSNAFVFRMGQGITPYNAVLAIVPYFLIQVLSVLGEEIGWRGFALPRLLSKNNWLLSGLILGALWALWHLPLFLTEGSPQSGMSAFWYNADLLASSMVFAWLFLRTKGSVLIATLFHASINSSVAFLPAAPMLQYDMTPYIIMAVLKWAIVAASAIAQKRSKTQTFLKDSGIEI